jgi:hypothetical protein
VSKKSLFEFKALLVVYGVALVFSKKSRVFYNADLENFMERLVFYAVAFVGEINHLKTFATFLGGPSMSVVQGLAHHGATASLVTPKVGMARSPRRRLRAGGRRRPTRAAQPPL